jgi:hypothetical protein
MSFQHRVRLLGPSFLIYIDETGGSKATAVFSIGAPPNQERIPLSSNTFTKVGGMPIGGPELISIEITGDITATLFPETNFETGPYAWAVFQRPPPFDPKSAFPGPRSVFDLQIFMDGKEDLVLFSSVIPGQEEKIPVSHTLALNDGTVYNDLDVGLLNVEYVIEGTVVKATPVVGKGEDTGGLFSGDIISFDIRFDASPEKWSTESFVRSTKGLPVIVFGPATAPMLGLVREFGPIEIVKLVHI